MIDIVVVIYLAVVEIRDLVSNGRKMHRPSGDIDAKMFRQFEFFAKHFGLHNFLTLNFRVRRWNLIIFNHV